LDAGDLLVIYVDGIQFGNHHVLSAVSADSDGRKHVLGMRGGASENTEVATAPLEDLVARGQDPGRRRLWVIDGSKALRKAIDQVLGNPPVQRCRNHKLRSLTGHLPRDSRKNHLLIVSSPGTSRKDQGLHRTPSSRRSGVAVLLNHKAAAGDGRRGPVHAVHVAPN